MAQNLINAVVSRLFGPKQTLMDLGDVAYIANEKFFYHNFQRKTRRAVGAEEAWKKLFASSDIDDNVIRLYTMFLDERATRSNS